MVALVVAQQDRDMLTSVADLELWDLHFIESCEEARSIAKQLSAPVILLDRDWPGTEWRIAVESLASLQQHASVILVSGVRDDYLWQEVIRRGGYDVLPKPLRADSVARIVKLALSYWKSAPKRVASGAKSSPEISLAALRLLRKRLEPKATLEAVEEAVLPPEDPLR